MIFKKSELFKVRKNVQKSEVPPTKMAFSPTQVNEKWDIQGWYKKKEELASVCIGLHHVP